MSSGLTTRLVLPSLGILSVLLLWTLISQTAAPDLPSPLKTWTESRRYVMEPFFKDGEMNQGIGRLQMYAYFPRLRERASQLGGTLSGGEQQMLAIARALMSCPRLFLLDEPSLGLAPVIVQRIGELIAEIQRSEGLAVILAEQNALWAMSLARRTAVIDLGRIHLEGPSEVLRHHEDVRRAYLGT